MADLGETVQQMERVTVDAVSFEELLGHCLAVLHSNKEGIARLEQHLTQYGYQGAAELGSSGPDDLKQGEQRAAAWGATRPL